MDSTLSTFRLIVRRARRSLYLALCVSMIALTPESLVAAPASTKAAGRPISSSAQSVAHRARSADPEDPASWMIVRIRNEGERESHCSGVIVSTSMIYTAGHCADHTTRNGQIVVEFVNPRTGEVTVARTLGHRPHSLYRSLSGRHTADVSAILLEGSIPDGFRIAPPPISRTEARLVQGQLMRAYTFGTSNLQSGSPMASMPQVIEQRFDTVGRVGYEYKTSLGPDRSEVCPGDSGGPFFITDSQGQLRLAGLISGAPELVRTENWRYTCSRQTWVTDIVALNETKSSTGANFTTEIANWEAELLRSFRPARPTRPVPASAPRPTDQST